jgi:argininosuccinate lyase
LVDVKLFLRNEIEELVKEVQPFFHLLLEQSEKYKQHLFPGYTHLQLAMPSSFGLWFGAYAESLVDDMITLKGAYEVVNKNPLGSAAGYGSSFPINRTLTTQLLGFADLNYNVVYAQMGRGKAERITAMALANLADTFRD